MKWKSQIDTRRDMDGKQLRSLRESLSLTQLELAKILGVQRVTITRAEGKKPSRLLQSLLDQALARGELKIPPDRPNKRTKGKKP